MTREASSPASRGRGLKPNVDGFVPPMLVVARFALPGEKRSRYSLPTALESGSPVGYRSRVGLSRAEGEAALQLLSLKPPTGFAEAGAHSSAVREAELFNPAFRACFSLVGW